MDHHIESDGPIFYPKVNYYGLTLTNFIEFVNIFSIFLNNLHIKEREQTVVE
ncbi:MAG: hypothetical protein HDR88_02780 [Bacteroides sp.]|nr:hypothetical protein [Bacteroides sp.]